MTAPGEAVPPPPARWYYHAAGQPCGPVAQVDLADALRKAVLAAETLVWREGFPNWLPAIATSEFRHAADRGWRLVRNAKTNCILLFVVFVLCVPWVPAVPMGLPRGSGFAPPGGACLGVLAAVATIFAAVYVPLRWRIIMGLPRAYKVLGLIGGFGLIAILLLAAIGLGAWLLTGGKLPGMP